MELISKKEAEQKGLKRFFTGRPCKRGHISERKISSQDCIECFNMKELERYYANQDYFKAKNRKWREEHKEEVRLRRKKYREDNSESIKEKAGIYRENNRELCRNSSKIHYQNNKEKIKEKNRLWWQNNKELATFYTIKRLNHIITATPKWSDLDKIKEIYSNRPKNYEVDHILPLRGKLVCGLHVPENLQYLSKEKNREKWYYFTSYNQTIEGEITYYE